MRGNPKPYELVMRCLKTIKTTDRCGCVTTSHIRRSIDDLVDAGRNEGRDCGSESGQGRDEYRSNAESQFHVGKRAGDGKPSGEEALDISFILEPMTRVGEQCIWRQ